MQCVVDATNGNGTGPESAPMTATPTGAPGPPSITSVSSVEAGLVVSFVPPSSDGGEPITAFTATCGSQSASDSASPITVSGLTDGTPVTCQVTATNSVGTGPPSVGVVGTPGVVPGAPTVTDVSPGGDGQLVVTFVAPTDQGSSPISSYTATCGSQSSSQTSSPITVSGLTDGVQVACTVDATNATGTGPESAAVSGTPVGPPAAPDITSVTPGDTQLTVAFSTPADNGDPIISYTATCGTQSTGGTASPITVTGLTNGVTVSCTVDATNAAGTGPASAPVSGTPSAGKPQVPGLARPAPAGAMARFRTGSQTTPGSTHRKLPTLRVRSSGSGYLAAYGFRG